VQLGTRLPVNLPATTRANLALSSVKQANSPT